MINHRECQVVLMKPSVDRLAAEIVQRVVHPAHVPLKRKAQAADIRWARHLRPRGGFFGNRHHAGKFNVHDVVELPEKINRLQIFASAVLVGQPLALLARVVQVKHRGHGVHAQAIDVKTFTPVRRVSGSEIGNLVAAIN